MNYVNKKIKRKEKGFTLIEMLVSVAIFALFLSVSASSLVNVIKVEQKTNVLRQTQQNARYIMETISREARSANGEIDINGERVFPAYSFNSDYTRLTITSTDTQVGKVTQKAYYIYNYQNPNIIVSDKGIKNIGDSVYIYANEDKEVALNNPNDIKITSLSFAGSISRQPDLTIPPKLEIALTAESGKGMNFVKDEYRAHVEFKTSVSPRNY
jgi:prepilin-type N-terminal cleavage/methylation domain-containing protein